MKKSFLALIISLSCYGVAFAQQDNPPPVVIKQEGATLQTEQQEDDVRNLPFHKRLRYGIGGLGLNFGSFYNSVSISPTIGYMITNDMMIGAEIPYQYSWGGILGAGNSRSLIGYRGFLRQNIPFLTELIGNGYARVEYEQYSLASGGVTFNPRPAFLAGIGLGATRGIQFLIMYDLNYKEGESVYASPLVIRGGLFF